jgi:hypothetical protein
MVWWLFCTQLDGADTWPSVTRFQRFQQAWGATTLAIGAACSLLPLPRFYFLALDATLSAVGGW